VVSAVSWRAYDSGFPLLGGSEAHPARKRREKITEKQHLIVDEFIDTGVLKPLRVTFSVKRVAPSTCLFQNLRYFVSVTEIEVHGAQATVCGVSFSSRVKLI
jgi:hypothetical protein